MTKAQLIIDLKNSLGPGVDVDATGLTNWLNDAYGYMVDEIIKANPDFFTKAELTTTVSGQQEYTLPTDFERMLMVNIQESGVWKRCRPLENINNVPIHEDTTTAGFSPADPRYYIYANAIGLLPIPGDSTDSIKIWFVYSPAELSDDNDVPAFPSRYHHLLKIGARAVYMGRDNESGQEMWERFKERVEGMVETMSTNQVDEPKTVQVTGNYDLYRDDDYYI